MFIKNCEMCGKPTVFNGVWGKYCKECAKQMKKEYRRIYNEAHKREKLQNASKAKSVQRAVLSVDEVLSKSKPDGLTYGQWVLKNETLKRLKSWE